MGLVKKDKATKSVSSNEIDETAIAKKETIQIEETPQEVTSSLDALVIKKADLSEKKPKNDGRTDFRRNANNDR
jgi:TATA-binding protein-associated factor Taf7